MYGLHDELCCDFPHCGGEYDRRRGKKIAIWKVDRVLAFCAKHAKRLREEGIELQTLAAIHAAHKKSEDAKVNARAAREEQAFIKSLKSGGAS